MAKVFTDYMAANEKVFEGLPTALFCMCMARRIISTTAPTWIPSNKAQVCPVPLSIKQNEGMSGHGPSENW